MGDQGQEAMTDEVFSAVLQPLYEAATDRLDVDEETQVLNLVEDDVIIIKAGGVILVTTEFGVEPDDELVEFIMPDDGENLHTTEVNSDISGGIPREDVAGYVNGLLFSLDREDLIVEEE